MVKTLKMKQEEVLMIFDSLVEEGVDIEKEVKSNIALRSRIKRAFPGTDKRTSNERALNEYGVYPMSKDNKLFEQSEPSLQEIESCLYTSSRFKVCFDEDFINHLISIYPISKKCLLSRIEAIKGVREIEVISEFARSFDDDELYYNRIKYEFWDVKRYIVKHYGSFQKFREAHGVNLKLSPFYTREHLSAMIQFGREFELLVGECLNEINETVDSKFAIEGCQPDFVSEDTWYDAKLSKSTVLDVRCKTIEKYRKHTDSLTIIYAIDDVDDVGEYGDLVDFVHISEYFPRISLELRHEINDFITKVHEAKRKRWSN